MTSILITSILAFMFGTIVGMFLVVLCQAGSERDNIYSNLTLIPIEAGEPRMDSCCIIQASGKLQENIAAHSAIVMAEYCEEGWILTDYPEAEDFTVEAWCYLPEPIRR